MHTISPQQRCAVLIAHPGHELVIHRFIEQTRPMVAILTDGSGATGSSRLDSTTRLLDPLGAFPANFYARYTDQDCYAALLKRDSDFFIHIAEKLADELVRERIEVIVGDAQEGWNPVHDIWRSVVNVAAALAEKRGRRQILNFDFVLFAPHGTAGVSEKSILVELDEPSYERKLHAAMAYAELHAEVQVALRGTTADLIPSPELSNELDARLGGLDADAYRVELLRRVEGETQRIAAPRVYELYGEMLVAQGRYAEAIRHDMHLLPIETSLRKHAIRETVTHTACASSSPHTA